MGTWLTMTLWHTMMTSSSNENNYCVTGHLCGEFTGHRWIPRTKASDAELWCLFREAGDLRRHRAHYDVTVMQTSSALPFLCEGNPHLWGESTRKRWNRQTNVQLWQDFMLLLISNVQAIAQTVELPRIYFALTLMWRHMGAILSFEHYYLTGMVLELLFYYWAFGVFGNYWKCHCRHSTNTAQENTSKTLHFPITFLTEMPTMIPTMIVYQNCHCALRNQNVFWSTYVKLTHVFNAYTYVCVYKQDFYNTDG